MGVARLGLAEQKVAPFEALRPPVMLPGVKRERGKGETEEW